MILIGQYDSPFVRRVGITLALYRLPFAHRPGAVFADGEKVRAFNPLMRVPTLVLDDDEVLFDSAGMIDALDDLARAHVARALEDQMLQQMRPAGSGFILHAGAAVDGHGHGDGAQAGHGVAHDAHAVGQGVKTSSQVSDPWKAWGDSGAAAGPHRRRPG